MPTVNESRGKNATGIQSQEEFEENDAPSVNGEISIDLPAKVQKSNYVSKKLKVGGQMQNSSENRLYSNCSV